MMIISVVMQTISNRGALQGNAKMLPNRLLAVHPHTIVSIGAVACWCRVDLCNGEYSVDVVQDFRSCFC